MLCALTIKNFAIITSLDIAFDTGLTVITGETGAGKSVLLSALNLVLGGRSKSEVIRTGEDCAEVEALFHLEKDSLIPEKLAQAEIPCDGELLVRRIVTRSGRSRIYLNGVLSSARQLSEITEGLVDISGQHEHLSLLRTEAHLELLDRIAGLTELRQSVTDAFNALKKTDEEIEAICARQRDRAEREAFLRFQLQELDAANLKDPDEENALELEAKRLGSVERLKTAADAIERELYSEAQSAQARISRAAKHCAALAEVESSFAAQCDELATALAIVEDVAREASGYGRDLCASPERLEEVQSRLALLARLRRKYGATLQDVIERRNELQRELDSLGCSEEKLEALENQRKIQGRALAEISAKLTAERQKGAKSLEAAVAEELASLEMARAILTVEVEPLMSGLAVDGRFYSAKGGDRVELLFSANRGEAPQALQKIASGGELSRLMLSVKRIIASRDAVSTYVFDEVDTGVGGPTAEAIGRKLSQVSEHAQILCITHLPQVASLGAHHMKVQKVEVDGRTVSSIRPLNGDDRVNEIARMLGGKRITEKTLAHAREMIDLGAAKQ